MNQIETLFLGGLIAKAVRARICICICICICIIIWIGGSFVTKAVCARILGSSPTYYPSALPLFASAL